MYTLALQLMREFNYREDSHITGLCKVLCGAIYLDKFNITYTEAVDSDDPKYRDIWRYVTCNVRNNMNLLEISKHKPKGHHIFWPITSTQRIAILEQAIKEVNPTDIFYYGQ